MVDIEHVVNICLMVVVTFDDRSLDQQTSSYTQNTSVACQKTMAASLEIGK